MRKILAVLVLMVVGFSCFAKKYKVEDFDLSFFVLDENEQIIEKSIKKVDKKQCLVITVVKNEYDYFYFYFEIKNEKELAILKFENSSYDGLLYANNFFNNNYRKPLVIFYEDGSERFNYTYYDNGNLKREKFYDKKGKLITRVEYNRRGQLTEELCGGLIKKTYDEKGNLIREIEKDEDGKTQTTEYFPYHSYTKNYKEIVHQKDENIFERDLEYVKGGWIRYSKLTDKKDKILMEFYSNYIDSKFKIKIINNVGHWGLIDYEIHQDFSKLERNKWYEIIYGDDVIFYKDENGKTVRFYKE